MVYVQRYTPRYRPQLRCNYVPRYTPQYMTQYTPRYLPRFRKMARYLPRFRYTPHYMTRFRELFQNRWDALARIRRQKRGAYTPEEWKMRLAEIQKQRRIKK